MKTPLKVLAVLALALVAFNPYSDAAATDVIKYKGLGAYARFFSTDPSGCINRTIWVSVLTDVQRPEPGVRDPLSEVYVSLDQFDHCTETMTSASGVAPLSKTDFDIGGNLESARLSATVSLYDWNLQYVSDVAVDLTWNGVGELSQRTTHQILTFMSCHYNQQSKDNSRFAQAAGTVSDGTTNFTPDASRGAYIFSAKTGQISHGCQ